MFGACALQISLDSLNFLESVPEGNSALRKVVDFTSGHMLLLESVQPNKGNRKRLWALRYVFLLSYLIYSDSCYKRFTMPYNPVFSCLSSAAKMFECGG